MKIIMSILNCVVKALLSIIHASVHLSLFALAEVAATMIPIHQVRMLEHLYVTKLRRWMTCLMPNFRLLSSSSCGSVRSSAEAKDALD